jgi:hypothetical protein
MRSRERPRSRMDLPWRKMAAGCRIICRATRRPRTRLSPLMRPFGTPGSGHPRACLALHVLCVARAHADLMHLLLRLCRQNVALSACASRGAHRAHLSQRQLFCGTSASGAVGDELCVLQKLNLNQNQIKPGALGDGLRVLPKLLEAPDLWRLGPRRQLDAGGCGRVPRAGERLRAWPRCPLALSNSR